MSEGSELHCFGAQQEKQRWPKVFVLTWGYEVSACLDSNDCGFIYATVNFVGGYK